MSETLHCRMFGTMALLGVLSTFSARADNVKTIFVIAMENHNWTQPTSTANGVQQILQNPAAPFINSLVNGSARALINGTMVNISEQAAYAAAYHNAGPDNPARPASDSSFRTELLVVGGRHQLRSVQ